MDYHIIPSKIDPSNDGINHINAYSKGQTELGRLLSNFANTPFDHDELGHFESMEGFWYYCSTGMIHDELKSLSGFDAKKFGRNLPVITNDKFKDLIVEGLECKLTQNEYLLDMCADNDLPYVHYYVHPDSPIKLDESFWIKALRKTISKLILFY